MKKILLTTLCTALLVSFAQHADARCTTPISRTTVALGTVGIAAGTWAGLKFIFDVPFNSFTSKGSLVVSTVALGAATASWWGFSSYTASGYLDSAKFIIDGDGSAQAYVLELLKESVVTVHSSQELATLVVDHFSAYENELAKSANALERLYNEMFAAIGYLRISRSGLNGFQKSQADHYKEIADEVVGKIKAVSLLIKGHEDYQRQYNNEMEKQKIAAQRETAGAIRHAGNAASMQAHYVYVG